MSTPKPPKGEDDQPKKVKIPKATEEQLNDWLKAITGAKEIQVEDLHTDPTNNNRILVKISGKLQLDEEIKKINAWIAEHGKSTIKNHASVFDYTASFSKVDLYDMLKKAGIIQSEKPSFSSGAHRRGLSTKLKFGSLEELGALRELKETKEAREPKYGSPTRLRSGSHSSSGSPSSSPAGSRSSSRSGSPAKLPKIDSPKKPRSGSPSRKQ